MSWFKFSNKTTFLKYAAVFVAYFVCVVGSAAQEVTFHTDDDAVAVTGRFLAFDGQSATVATVNGLVTFRTNGMTCTGDACPDLANHVPTLRMIGAARMGNVLLPALIDVYARDRGWTVIESARGFEMQSANGAPTFAFEIAVAPPDAAFDAFVDHQADALLSMRELRGSELDRASEAGLGRLNLARQGRIVALDALVPVVSSGAALRSISLAELTAELAGQGQLDVHLTTDIDDQIQGFEDRFMRPFGLTLDAPETSHASMNDLLSAVAGSDNALSLVPFRTTGTTKPLALDGPCGLQANARFLTMKTEDYPLTFPMFVYLPQRLQHPQIVDFLDWLRSPSAQLVIRRAGFVDLAAVPISLAEQGNRLANAIVSAGPEIPLTELQRMVDLMSPRVRMSSTFRFEPGSTRLDGQSRSNVMQLAQAIRDGRFSGRELTLIGFSDGRGPATANRDLSSARAESVRRELTRVLGGNLPANVQLTTAAFGEAMPMACDDTVWGQQTNRRVELWVRDAG